MQRFVDENVMRTWLSRLSEKLEGDDNSSCDESSKKETLGGSRIGRPPNKKRYRIDGAARIYTDFVSSNPIFSDYNFRSRYRMQKFRFLRIHNTVAGFGKEYYMQRKDACGILNLISLNKTFSYITDAGLQHAG